MPPTVRTRASVVCRHEGRLLTVRAVDPVSGQRHLFLPGGRVEPGEAPARAAGREAMEETGYVVAVDVASETVLDYSFFWAGRDHACRTHFFRATLRDATAGRTARGADETYLHDVEWVPVERIDDVFGYYDVIRRAVRALA